MNKNKIMIGILFVFFLNILTVNFVEAQVFNIGEPVCVRGIEGMPCPDDVIVKPIKKVPTPTMSVSTGFSKLFDYLTTLKTKIGDLTKYTHEGLRGWFGNVYDNLIHKFEKI